MPWNYLGGHGFQELLGFIMIFLGRWNALKDVEHVFSDDDSGDGSSTAAQACEGFEHRECGRGRNTSWLTWPVISLVKHNAGA